MTNKKQNPKFNPRRLRIFNLVMAGFHFIQGALMLTLSSSFKLPVTTSFVEYNPALKTLYPVLEKYLICQSVLWWLVFYFYQL